MNGRDGGGLQGAVSSLRQFEDAVWRVAYNCTVIIRGVFIIIALMELLLCDTEQSLRHEELIAVVSLRSCVSHRPRVSVTSSVSE